MSNSAVTPTAFFYTPLTNWIAYTPTYTGITATGSTWYRRVGDTIEVQGFVQASAASATTLKISLPAGLTIDTSKIPGLRKTYLGHMTGGAGGTTPAVYSQSVGVAVVYDSADDSAVFLAFNASSDGSGFAFTASVNGIGYFNPTSQGSFKFSAPITQWAF